MCIFLSLEIYVNKKNVFFKKIYLSFFIQKISIILYVLRKLILSLFNYILHKKIVFDVSFFKSGHTQIGQKTSKLQLKLFLIFKQAIFQISVLLNYTIYLTL